MYSTKEEERFLWVLLVACWLDNFVFFVNSPKTCVVAVGRTFFHFSSGSRFPFEREANEFELHVEIVPKHYIHCNPTYRSRTLDTLYLVLSIYRTSRLDC
jgi:hypothetical protein